jgi:hypothetical protein
MPAIHIHSNPIQIYLSFTYNSKPNTKLAMHVQSIVTRPEPEPFMAKSEAAHSVNGQELNPETIKCHICREHA